MNKLEDLFKKSLENAEAPYDAKAWESMASRLDQAMPTSLAKGSFKWAWIAGVVLVAGSTALLFVNQNSKPKQNTELAQTQLEPTAKDLNKENGSIKSTDLEKESVIAELANKEVISVNSTSIKQNVTAAEKTNQLNGVSDKSNEELVQVKSNEISVEKVKTTEISRPKKEDKIISIEEKFVKERVNTKIDFSASNETFYEKGLPFNSLTSNVEAKKYVWTNEKGEILATDKNADIHLFTVGTHLITLTVEFSNGEKLDITKPVRCEMNYNLLAVTGFNPTSSDYRNNTFIPFALLKTERNISFDMQILDPKSGQVIFETRNADNPWDGIDARTNQMVPVNSTYIWRVNIHEKAVGEPTNRYQGTITRI